MTSVEGSGRSGVNRVLAEAAKHDFPVNLLCWERLEQVSESPRPS